MDTLGSRGSVTSISTLTLAKPIFLFFEVKSSKASGLPASDATANSRSRCQNSNGSPGSHFRVTVLLITFFPGTKSGTYGSTARSLAGDKPWATFDHTFTLLL